MEQLVLEEIDLDRPSFAKPTPVVTPTEVIPTPVALPPVVAPVVAPPLTIAEPKKETAKHRKIWGSKFSKAKLKKPNTVAVIYLRRNGVAQPIVVESKNGFFNINNKTYHEDRDCIYRFGREKHPLAIIPEWNVTPIGKIEWEDKDMQEKFHTLEDHVMKGIRHAERVRMGEKEPMKMNGKAIVGIIIMVLVGGAFLLQYVGT